MWLDKSLLTTLLAFATALAGWLIPAVAGDIILTMGLFALAGSVTNWLAVHMLFEKVPGLYGSGIIPERFEAFRDAIQRLIMVEFFSPDRIERFAEDLFTERADRRLDFSEIIEHTDLSPAFDSLVNTVLQSSFGSMLSMVGGQSALKPLRKPFIKKLRQALDDIAHSESFQRSVRDKMHDPALAQTLHAQVSQIVANRLEELTPERVKDIVQTMIREHLGWLVVWGGVFGALFGLVTGLLQWR